MSLDKCLRTAFYCSHDNRTGNGEVTVQSDKIGTAGAHNACCNQKSRGHAGLLQQHQTGQGLRVHDNAIHILWGVPGGDSDHSSFSQLVLIVPGCRSARLGRPALWRSPAWAVHSQQRALSPQPTTHDGSMHGGDLVRVHGLKR